MHPVDALNALPFRYELLGALTHTQTLVLSAILYAARRYPLGEWFFLPDQTVMRWTGLSRQTIWRVRKQLERKGLVERLQGAAVNQYRLTEDIMRKIMELSAEILHEHVERVLATFPQDLRELARAFHEETNARPRFTWLNALEKLKRMGYTPESIRQTVRQLRAEGFAPIKPEALVRKLRAMRFAEQRKRAKERREQSSQAQASQQEQQAQKPKRRYYHYQWRKDLQAYVPVPLPDDATHDIVDEPEVEF
ncbi:MAG: hypothetical protein RML84_09100 [Anaerolineae bacterium]|nr:hypothetical protein [Anaerolineae bacterium]